MLTNLGKRMRKLRIDHDERLLDMGNKLGKSASFISAIETGAKEPPRGFEEQIAAAYELDPIEAANLLALADQARTNFKLNPKSGVQRETVGLMARRLNDLTEDQMRDIRGIIEDGRRKRARG